MGSTLYFSAYTPTEGTELRKTTGTGESLVSDIFPGANGSYPFQKASFGDSFVFTASDPVGGQEQWISDGAQSERLADVNPGLESSAPGPPVAVGNRVYFNAYSPEFGYELWSAAAPGDARVHDLMPGKESSSPYDLRPFNGELYMAVFTPDTGYEPWIGDGQKFSLIRDILPGPTGSELYSATGQGDSLLITTDDGTHGVEPWRLFPDREVRVKLLGKRVGVSRKGFAGLRLTCPADEANGPCRIKVSVSTRKKVRVGKKRRKLVLARKSLSIQPGKTGMARLEFTKARIALLRRSTVARKVTVTVTGRDTAGNRRATRTAFALGRPS